MNLKIQMFMDHSNIFFIQSFFFISCIFSLLPRKGVSAFASARTIVGVGGGGGGGKD